MTKKEMAQDFLKLASSGNPRKAFELYVPTTLYTTTLTLKATGKP